ncbi:hypothetical protein LTS14_007740 [Recurvomyces mirabilis]|nr:hypothetical protein LTS14_007740 [Recurvomyces mirabilis]
MAARSKARRGMFFMSEYDLERVAELKARGAELPGWSEIMRSRPQVAYTTEAGIRSEISTGSGIYPPFISSSQHALEQCDGRRAGASLQSTGPGTAQPTPVHSSLPQQIDGTDISTQATSRQPLLFTSCKSIKRNDDRKGRPARTRHEPEPAKLTPKCFSTAMTRPSSPADEGEEEKQTLADLSTEAASREPYHFLSERRLSRDAYRAAVRAEGPGGEYLGSSARRTIRRKARAGVGVEGERT